MCILYKVDYYWCGHIRDKEKTCGKGCAKATWETREIQIQCCCNKDCCELNMQPVMSEVHEARCKQLAWRFENQEPAAGFLSPPKHSNEEVDRVDNELAPVVKHWEEKLRDERFGHRFCRQRANAPLPD